MKSYCRPLGALFLGMSSLANAPEPVRVVTFGTSITARGGWQAPLAGALSQCLGRPVAISRIGGPGQGSAWGLRNAWRVVALKPDLVVMEFAINDADIRNWTSRDRSRRNTLELIRRLETGGRGAKVLLLTTQPVEGWKRLLRPFLGSYYQEYRRIAQETGVPLADGEAAWLALPGAMKKDALSDGVHPSPRVFAAAVVPAVRRAIRC